MNTKLLLLAAILSAIFGLPPASAAESAPTTEIEMVRVTGGCFQMGTLGYEKHELPLHQVCIDSFDIGKYEVTQAQWKAVMGSNVTNFPACGDVCPVDQVTWNQAQEFINKLNTQGNGNFRLPTEAEWEYACRSGGKNEIWPGGFTAENVAEIAWFDKDAAGSRTHPVGTKKPNGLGIHDMAGNVWEWVQDKFVSPYPTVATKNPRIESGGEEKRVMRGGSWAQKVNYVRCGIRSRYEPNFFDHFGRVGMRLVREVKE